MESAGGRGTAPLVWLGLQLALAATVTAVLAAVAFEAVGLPSGLGAGGGALLAATVVLLVRTFTAPARSPDADGAFWALKERGLVAGVWGAIAATLLGTVVELVLAPRMAFFLYPAGGALLGAGAYSVGWAFVHLFTVYQDPCPTPAAGEPAKSSRVPTDPDA